MSDRISQLIRVLGQLPAEQSEVLLKKMFLEDPLTALKVIQRHFGFEDLVYADETGLDNLLDALGTETLVIALNGASDDLIRAFAGRMGTGLARTFIDDIHDGTPSPHSVQRMRQATLMKAMILLKKGMLKISRPGIER